MPYVMNVKEEEVLGKGKYANSAGKTECAYFVQQVTTAPATAQWKKGAHVKSAQAKDIARGTAIATFDDAGKYPTDGAGKHAAIYLSHNDTGITVLDQWNNQGEVKQRVIRFNRTEGVSRSNNGDVFYVIEDPLYTPAP
jgi:hypothetical protein